MHRKQHLFAFCAAFFGICQFAISHPGGLDAQGGHTDRKTGEYHQHIKGGGRKPYKPKPRKPLREIPQTPQTPVAPEKDPELNLEPVIPDPLAEAPSTLNVPESTAPLSLEARLKRLAEKIEAFATKTGQALAASSEIRSDNAESNREKAKSGAKKGYQSPLQRLAGLEKKLLGLEAWRGQKDQEMSRLEHMMKSLDPIVPKGPSAEMQRKRQELLRLLEEKNRQIQILETRLAKRHETNGQKTKLAESKLAQSKHADLKTTIAVDPFAEDKAKKPAVKTPEENKAGGKEEASDKKPSQETVTQIMVDEIRALLPIAAEEESE